VGPEELPVAGMVVSSPASEPNLNIMKSSTQDKAEGTGKQLKGGVKQAAGRAVGNPRLDAEGGADKAAGKVQKKVGDVKKVFDK
jgi:uncharacterized protein YjbJ (UPF0337 family)